MTATTSTILGNPFTTRHTRPGRLVPRDAHGEPLDLGALVAEARRLHSASIVGPHGAGKTNLLANLAGGLADAGVLAGTVRVRSRRDGMSVLRATLLAARGAILCIDGWEALGGAWAGAIRQLSRWRDVGLLVTCHAAVGWPVLVRCSTTPTLLARLVADLPDHGGLLTATDVAEAFTACRGDVREALYDLYDRFERRARRR